MGRNNKNYGNGSNRKRFHPTSHRNNNRNHDRSNALRPTVYSSLKENEIGITEYTTSTNGFTGIIKQRISDFHVNEIGYDGVMCKLSDFTLPKPTEAVEKDLANKDEFIGLVTQEKYDAIQAIEMADSKCSDEVLINVTSMEKTERTQIHQMIKELFFSVNSNTFDKDNSKFIKCFKLNKKNDKRSRWIWPHEYTYFLLHKDNIDTMQAISNLAPFLNTRASAISYAGTKDKRARTTQWACIRKREPLHIVRAAQKAKNMYVGGFRFRDEPLKLGMLQGNRFRIALRQVTATDDIVNEAVQSFNEKGFINYYGHQRFGNHAAIPTHQIGLALVKGDFKQACECILKPRTNDVPEMNQVRELWWRDRDAKQALECLKKYDWGGRSIEFKLLSGFVKNSPNDYVNSLENIPRNVRLMYIHAYQSLIWNEMVSRRITTFGLELCEGDLVLVDQNSTNNEILDEDIDEDDDKRDESADVQSPQQNSNVSKFQAMVKPLTKSDIESKKYTIFDIVLPLPGYDITYPSNDCAKWYTERLEKDGLTSDKLKLKQKCYSLSGAYRKAFLKPIDLKWYFMNYNVETDPLIRSDIEEIRGEPEPRSIEGGSKKAVILEFTLPSSSYATMALREIMKCDTSVANQVQLQQATAIIEPVTINDEALDTTDDQKTASDTDVVNAKQLKLDV